MKRGTIMGEATGGAPGNLFVFSFTRWRGSAASALRMIPIPMAAFVGVVYRHTSNSHPKLDDYRQGRDTV